MQCINQSAFTSLNMETLPSCFNRFNSLAVAGLLTCSAMAQKFDLNQILAPNDFPARDKTDKLSLEEKERQIDKENMLQIHHAIFSYFRDHGDLPEYLSTLVPKYLPDPDVLISPKEKRTGKSVLYGREDPDLQVSYIYEFNAMVAPEAFNRNRENPLTCKEWKLMQLKQYGLITPMLRCHLHSPVLNVSFSGDFYESGLLWENDSGPLILLRQRPELGPFSKLSSKQSIRITVVDADHKRPIPNASVRVSLAGEFGLLPNQTLLTDPEGSCTFPLGDWRINDVFVNVSAPAHLTTRYHWSARNNAGTDQQDRAPQPKQLVLHLATRSPDE